MAVAERREGVWIEVSGVSLSCYFLDGRSSLWDRRGVVQGRKAVVFGSIRGPSGTGGKGNIDEMTLLRLIDARRDASRQARGGRKETYRVEWLKLGRALQVVFDQKGIG